jgi:hydrogenase nickel incorporation protein HypB
MCGVCGCGEGETAIGGHRHEHHDHAAGAGGKRAKPTRRKAHSHAHDHGHRHQATPLFGPGAVGNDLVTIEQGILSKNDGFAAENRARFAELGLLALNLVSSPGAGKTSLLVATIERLKKAASIAVIEGDQATENDADRIRATGVPAIQINTGRGCHLDAHMVGHAFEELPLEAGGILFIENVGNLVCPAAFDLGEAHKVAILSVTEGEDKPIKYLDMFAAADLMILAKTDLLPHLDFDVAACIEAARRVNPAIEVIQLSARSGEGMGEWFAWIDRAAQRLRGAGTPARAGSTASALAEV